MSKETIGASKPAVKQSLSNEWDEFETWIKSRYKPGSAMLQKDADGDYCHMYTMLEWGGWKARADMLAADARDPDLTKPPCGECGAMTATEAETMCICGGDKDDCQGTSLWPDDEPAQQVAVPQAEMNPLWLATHPDKLGPPQAERVPMTQSEIDDLPSCGVNDGSQAWLRGFLRLVEAHHGIGVKP